MTFEDLRKFAKKHNIDNDENGIYLYPYTLYPEGEIWMNRRSYLPRGLDVTVKLAEERTPAQMKKFVESLL